MKERNIELDILKGCGILLMIIGHCNFPYSILRVIFTFHMPLFFLISGFLYKEKPLVKRIKGNMKKIILPYIFTCFIVWLYFIIYKNDYMWGLSIFTANGSLPVFNYNNLKVGPLWFLVCYFVAAIYFHYLLKIRNEWFRIVLLMSLFAVAMVYKHYFNLLPLDILNAVPATMFLYLGYELRNKSFSSLCFNNKTCLVIGLCVGVICCLKGDLSMASLNYKLWYFQFFGALYCCFILHRLLIFLKVGGGGGDTFLYRTK